MQQPTLVILAAGMASRYGSMKQIQSFGPSGETIMEYSIYDAIKAGFKKVVFIIREDFAEAFREIIEPKLGNKIEIGFVFQKLESFTEERPVPAGRTKPWGTAHAVLCCEGTVNEPFAVINADDFYGSDAFKKAYNFLTGQCNDQTYCIIGYELKKTLSENGSVSRGVCEVDNDNNLISIAERTKIYRNEKGEITYEDENGKHIVSEDSKVSMNFWGFAPNIFDVTKEEFNRFLDENISNPKSEFFIPIVADHFIKDGAGKIKVIPTSSQWFGVTYKEDAPAVQKSIDALVATGEYPDNLWR
ncbi:MAG: nucleotidyltransferase [Chitinophagaceae bacterium]|nr:nucleotidyltransferase [Chitinophagaceae bacterium]